MLVVNGSWMKSKPPRCLLVLLALHCSLLNSLDLDENTKAVLVENIQRKLTQQAVKIRSIEGQVFSF